MKKVLLVAALSLASIGVASAQNCNDQTGKPLAPALCAAHYAYTARLTPTPDLSRGVWNVFPMNADGDSAGNG